MSAAWCRTEAKTPDDACFLANHNVVALASGGIVKPSGRDPAVQMWRESTSARLRRVSDQDPNALAWCWTEDQLATFRCRERQHDVREHRGFASPDPAVKQWGQAMAQSTGARLREALAANDALAKEHGLCVIEVERLRAELKRANEAGLRLVGENHRLRDRITSLTGTSYHLTDKGLAATAQPETE